MANEEIMSILNRLTANLDHSPSREELKALLDTIATVIGFEGEGWLKIITSTRTSAEFNLVRLPPDDMTPIFVQILCIKYKLSDEVGLAGLSGKYSFQSSNGYHKLHIGDSVTNYGSLRNNRDTNS